ncbi:MAG: hypothetical protein EOP51_15285 [Sphingobacteriales bacterium]|nr:MAG: hypothetical protein EOP51_15285 [Sphingobacteriales bacterium]
MKTPFQNASGISLIAATIVTVATITMHPSGGDTGQILKMQHMLITSHSIIIFSLPFLLFGFFGVASALSGPGKLSFLGLIIMGVGLFAALIAATLNGITLPLFIAENYRQNEDLIALVRSYGMALSGPMASIFIAMYSVAIFIWSLLLVRCSGPCKWAGYFGIAILAITGIGYLSGFNLISLGYFRIFIFGIIAWNLSAGMLLITGKINMK